MVLNDCENPDIGFGEGMDCPIGVGKSRRKTENWRSIVDGDERPTLVRGLVRSIQTNYISLGHVMF